jgi:tetratricopeptide (TPR) repeat protein
MSNPTPALTRKEMKDPDKFQVAAGQALTWLSGRKRAVVGVVAVIAAVLVGAAVISQVVAARDRAAGAMLSEVLSAVNGEVSAVPLPGLPGPFYPTAAEKQKAVLAAADRLVEQHPGSAAARTARLAKGDAHYALGEWDAAVAAYEAFIAHSPDADPLAFGAYEGIALAREAKGDADGALAGWDRMRAALPGFADRADLEKARVLAQGGKVAEARAILEKFPEAHEKSPLKADASERLAKLGGG